MTTATELKSEHLEKIKTYLKEYVSAGKDILFGHHEADSFAAYTLTVNGLYIDGYAHFKASDGSELTPSIVDSHYQDSAKLYSNEDFYKHLQYDLASKLLNSIKE
jgi:hypothetical protein